MTAAPPVAPKPSVLLRGLLRLVAWIADLRLAILLLLVIALASGIGTAIPQRETSAFYHQRYDGNPWLGVLHANGVLALQLDHVYSSGWFLGLLAWLGLALLLCSWRRQWPALQAGLRWVDYSTARQLSKLSVAESRPSNDPSAALNQLEQRLRLDGWQIQRQELRLAARRGLVGRVGPLLVHAGLVVLIVGAAWGAVAGQRMEQFLAPGRTLDLLDSRGQPHLSLRLDAFRIERDPAGRPEQFQSTLHLQEGAQSREARISVNHPLRYRGITLYQADWSLVALSLQLGRSPVLELPLQPFPQLGEQVWGLVLPTRPDGTAPVLLSVGSEQGPVDVYGPDGRRLASLEAGGDAEDVAGLPIRVVGILPASGILLKRDPGVPLVYSGFAIALLGGGLSLVATRQLWAIADRQSQQLHVGGLCNRNLVAFAAELPSLLSGPASPGA